MRVQTGDLQPAERLRPVQQTGDTYVRPEQAPINNDMERLSSALGAFAGSLTGLARMQAKDQQKGEDPRLAEVRKITLSMGDSDFMKALHEGRIPYQDVDAIRAFTHATAGERAARQIIEPIRMGVEQGTIPLTNDDGTPRNIGDIVRERAAKGLEQYGQLAGSEHFSKAYYGTYDKSRDSLEESARKQQAKLNNEALKNLAADAMDAFLTGPARDADPAKTTEGLMKTYENIRKVFGSGFPNSSIEDVLMGRLRVQAEKDPDTVVKILTMDRGKGTDGQPLGRLVDNVRLSVDARELLEKATKQQATNFDKVQEQQAAKVALDALKRGDGSFNQLQDITYQNPYARPLDATKKISASSAKDLALAQFEQETQTTLRSQRVPEDQVQSTVFERMANSFIGNNISNPRWSATITDTGRILANEVEASDPKNREKLMVAAQLYRQIEDRNPGYAAETLKVGKREQEFFTLARVYEEEMGMPKDLAIQKAAVHISRPRVPLSAEAKDSIERASTRVTSGLSMVNAATEVGGIGEANNPFGYSPQNVIDIQRRVRTLAEVIASDQGIPPEKAVDAALKAVRRSSVMINGQVIHADPHISKETKPAVERLLTNLQNDTSRVISNSLGDRHTGAVSLQPVAGRKGIYYVTTPAGDPLVETRTVKAPDNYVDPYTGQRGIKTERQLLRITADDIRMESSRMKNEDLDRVKASQINASTAREQAIMKAPNMNPEVQAQARETLNKAGVQIETPAEREKRLTREAEERRKNAPPPYFGPMPGEVTPNMGPFGPMPNK